MQGPCLGRVFRGRVLEGGTSVSWRRPLRSVLVQLVRFPPRWWVGGAGWERAGGWGWVLGTLLGPEGSGRWVWSLRHRPAVNRRPSPCSVLWCLCAVVWGGVVGRRRVVGGGRS